MFFINVSLRFVPLCAEFVGPLEVNFSVTFPSGQPDRMMYDRPLLLMNAGTVILFYYLMDLQVCRFEIDVLYEPLPAKQ